MEGGKAISWHLRGAWEAGVPASSSLLGFEIRALAQALGTYSAAFVNGLWFSDGLFVGSLIVQSLGRVSLQPHGLQHTRPPCLSLSPRVCSNSCPLRCHATISSSVAPSPALNLSQHQGLFQRVGSSHQVATVLGLQLQHQSFQ